MAASLALSLLMCEALVRFVAPQNLSGTWRTYSAQGNLINKAGGGARHQLGERTVVYRFNGQHLRGGPLRTGTTRVLCLGDSWTFGWLVEEGDAFVTLLGGMAARDFPQKNVEFLNGGAGGWGTADYVAFAEEFGDALAPNLVAVFLNFDDIHRSVDSGRFAWSDRSRTILHPVSASGAGAHRLIHSIRHFPGYQWLLEHSHLLQIARKAGVQVTSARTAVPSSSNTSGTGTTAVAEQIKLGQAIFARLQHWCRERNVPLIVIDLGVGSFYWNTPDTRSETLPDRTFHAEAPDFFARQGIGYVDLSPMLREATHGNLTPYFIPNDGHFNEKGHALFARLAWAVLKPHVEQLGNPPESQSGTGQPVH